MKQEIVDRWITKLRSGEYNQTNGFLGSTVERPDRPAGYCCLGVLCEIAVEDGILTRQSFDTGSVAYGDEEEFNTADYQQSFLPASTVAWLGRETPDEGSRVDVTNIYFDVTDVQERLDMQDITSYDRFQGRIVVSASTLNDHHKFTFNDIADLLEGGKMVENFSVNDSDGYNKA